MTALEEFRIYIMTYISVQIHLFLLSIKKIIFFFLTFAPSPDRNILLNNNQTNLKSVKVNRYLKILGAVK